MFIWRLNPRFSIHGRQDWRVTDLEWKSDTNSALQKKTGPPPDPLTIDQRAVGSIPTRPIDTISRTCQKGNLPAKWIVP